MRSVLSLLVLAACAQPLDMSGLPGPVRGRVLEQSSLRGVQGALVEVTEWPRVYGGGIIGSEHSAWVAHSDPDGSFAFDPLHDGAWDASQAIPAGRARIRVTAPGYLPVIYYRDLTYHDTCEVDLDGRALVGCESWNFDLIPEDRIGADLLPDVMVDPGSIAECRLRGSGDDRILRVTVATPNAGRGPVDMVSVPESTVVRQVIHETGGGTREEVLDRAGFVWDGHEGHNHFHFENWTHLRVLDAQGTHILATGHKISFCLIDLASFDREIYEDIWGHPTNYGCGVFDGVIQQGLSPGLMDVYDWTLAGQEIDISDLAPGDYLVEVEVDPEHVTIESSIKNNVARVRLTIPEGAVSSEFNPCTPDYSQSFLGGEVPLDTSGRTELTLAESCDDAPEAPIGAYWGDLSANTADSPLGDGQDGLFKVTVPAGNHVTVDANLLPGDVMVALLDDCDGGGVLDSSDQYGWGVQESVGWTNTTGSSRAIYVLVDDYEAPGTAGTFTADVALH